MPQPEAPTSSFTAVYDAWNRPVSLWGGGVAIGTYRYDGLTRRVSKLVSGTLRDVYYTAAWRPIEERLSGATSADRQFVWGLRYIDDLVLRDRASERLYGIQDPNWNLTAICDATGAVQERYRYAAYGLPTVLTPAFVVRGASSFDWETRFAGYRFDAESGLYQVRYRTQHPLLASWTTRDPSHKLVNSYEYAAGGPQSASDPRGLDPTGPADDDPPATDGKRQCKVSLCCRSMTIGGIEYACQGGNDVGKVPCHCYVRLRAIIPEDEEDEEEQHMYDLDYHGFGGTEISAECKYGRLRCGHKFPPELKITLIGKPACTDTIIDGNCEDLKKCLDDEMDSCNNKGPKPRNECYNLYCAPPNSNTSAYRFVNAALNCLKKTNNGKPKIPKPPIPPKGKIGNCTFAPGYEEYPKPKTK
ncbi:MAG TPA: RHS repeat-associated core domain-containing protein, partial [Pirellulales bacterium]|nr:RHS repeat-associated core domain-containing protein [Pirellulales bacterium]